MDHNMVLSYDYSNRNSRRWRTNAPPSRAVLMAMAVCRCGTKGVHRPMKHDQGFTGSHWMPPLVDYSLRIAPAATRATANETTMQNVPTLLAVSVVIAMRRYYTARIDRWRRFVAFIKATEPRHRASSRSDIIKPDMPSPVGSDISS